jgi:glutathione peroxidase
MSLSVQNIANIPVRRNDGKETTLAEFQGKVVLIVNVASKCGLTPQYAGLQELYRRYRERGFVIAAFPSNDFAGQEPGTNEEIRQFCSLHYQVDFPLYAKIPVVGEHRHPLYTALIQAQPKARSTAVVPFAENLMKYGIQPNPEPEILWNFEKFLLSREGEVIARFSPDTAPDNPVLLAAIEKELGK